jgi:hypothetical protein
MNEKCVIAIARGGIGNQMFIYAASKQIALRNNAKLILVTDLFENELHGRHFLLDQFSISAEVTTIKNSALPYSVRKHHIAKRLGRYFYLLSKNFPHYFIERTKNFVNKRVPVDSRALKAEFEDYLIVDGFFQNEKYFHEIKNTIKSDFSLKEAPSKQTQLMAKEIIDSNSVCIHFRRTELEQKAMLEKHGEKKWMKGYPQGLGKDYYLKAIEIIEKKIGSPRYFCFSDHPDWVRENIDLSVPVTFISQNNTQTTCQEDIYLMGLCKHHIISHSTFGWWGAWLSENPDQLVVAPVNVCGRPKPPDYPNKWISIEVCQRKVF